MKKLLLALALSLLPSLAWAQCNGVFSAGNVCGSTAGGIPKAVPFANFSGFITQLIATNTSAPASASGQTVIEGTIAIPTLTNTGQAFLYNTASLGAVLQGNGSANDIQFINKNGTGVCSISTGTTTFTCNTLSLINPLTLANGGTNATTQSAAATNIFPTPTRAGDVAYWNGSTWVTLAGNNSGTQVLQETSAGVPSWVPPTSPALVPQVVPGGRLTYISGTPVPNADNASVTSLFYAPCGGVVQGCAGPFIPLYNGTNVTLQQFTSSSTDTVGLTLTLNAAAQLSGNLYDVFVGNNAGLQLCTGPAWSVSTAGSSARGTGASTTQLALFQGIWTNAVSMTCKFSASNFTCAVNQCTYVGTMFATANGTTAVQIHPAATSLGPNSIVGICNAYNRVHVIAKAQDSTTTWNVQVNPPGQMANNSASNRIRYIDCLGTVQIQATYNVTYSPNAAGAIACTVGIGFNIANNISGGAGAGARLMQGASTTTQVGGMCIGQYAPYPSLGLNFIQGMEESSATPPAMSFFGNDFMMISLEYEM